MERIDQTLLVPKSGNYRIAKDSAMLDRTLMAIAGDYRANTSRRYFTIPQHELATRYSGTEKVLISTKYDGEGVFVFYSEGEEAFCFNAPSGRVRIGLPCLDRLVEKLKAVGVSKCLLAAELYLPRDSEDGIKPTVADVVHASFSAKAELNTRLSLAVFDIIMLDGQDWRKNEDDFAKTWEEMGRIFGEPKASELVHRVAGSIKPETQAEHVFEAETAKGEEGLVIRRLSRKEIVKVKPSITIDGVAIGYVEDSFEGQYGVTSILVGLTGKDNIIREFVRVGSGFTDEQRVKLLPQLQTLRIDSPVIKTDSDGRPIHFIKPKIILEVSGENLERETYSGKANLTQTFVYTSKYYFVGVHAFPRLTHATFNRFRDDKDLADGGARATQVISEEENRGFSLGTEQVTAEPKVLERIAFTKQFKGETSLRKFLLLQTDGNQRFPFLAYMLDYSPTRKKPFETTIKGAFTKPRAKALFDNLVEENSGRGWNQMSIAEDVEIDGAPTIGASTKASESGIKSEDVEI